MCSSDLMPMPASETVRVRASLSGAMRTLASGGRVLVQRPVRPMGVVMVGVLAEDQLQVPFAGDQHSVQALAAGTGDPAFGYGIAPHRQLHPVRTIGTGASG